MYPSGDDKRVPVDSSTVGASVGQIAPDFSLFDTEYNTVTMSAELVSTDGIVLYFAMWGCPTCASHMNHLRKYVIPNYPNVKFYIVDYTSKTVELSRTSQVDNKYTDLTVLVDNTQEVLTLYEATMATTVVIENAGSHGIVRMNEDYKDATRLIDTLNALP